MYECEMADANKNGLKGVQEIRNNVKEATKARERERKRPKSSLKEVTRKIGVVDGNANRCSAMQRSPRPAGLRSVSS